MRRAVFRVDASDSIGTGHVMRCLVLAGELQSRQFEVGFVCRAQPGNLCALIEERGFRVMQLPAAALEPGANAPPPYASWLGCDWQQDAAQTADALAQLGGKPDWLIVDHYAIDARWEQAMAAHADQLMAIDDLADRPHEASLLLDQNLVEGMRTRYDGKLRAGCKQLLGPEYALLQPIYAGLHDAARVRSGPLRRVLLHFGGYDPHALTAMALEALLALRGPELEIDVVLPLDPASAEAVRKRALGARGLRLHGWLPSLANLFAEADLAVGAGGVSNWERLCLGLPALVLSTADNQRAIAAELARRGLVQYLGHHDAVDAQMLSQALAGLLAHGSDPDWSRRCLQAVDGRGAARIGAILTAGADTPLHARLVGAVDEARLLEWANDADTRRNAFSTAQIAPSEHHEWLARRLQEADCRFYILESEPGVAVASVRFQREGEEWEVHFVLAPAFRGKGLGAKAVGAAIERLRADNIGRVDVLGKVKEGNVASRKIFESLGFECGTAATAAVLSYRRSY